MESLTPVQRNALYLQEAERTGIHKPILAALYHVHHEPSLLSGETGLGISPANRISLEQVNTLSAQIRYAANTVRSLTQSLIDKGWSATDLWNIGKGHYTDQFIRAIASGYTPPGRDATAAILESTHAEALIKAYQTDWIADLKAGNVPNDLIYLDKALRRLLEQIPSHYFALPYQRDALLEMVRIWHKQDSREAAIAALNLELPADEDSTISHESYLDRALLKSIPQISQSYSGYPHQREALLRLTQLWRRLNSREAAIASLEKNTSPEASLTILDPALIALIQRIPYLYEAKGEQRNALVEGFRLWQQLETRSVALMQLGVNPEIFSSPNPQQNDLTAAAIQIDQALLDFIHHIPAIYKRVDHQQEALLHLTQLWRGIATRDQTIQTLIEDLKRMQRANRGSQDASPSPVPIILPARPDRWTPSNLQLHAAIIPNGSFTWATATQGGAQMPKDQTTIDAIAKMAHLAQQVQDRLGRPLRITNWYQPADANTTIKSISSDRHCFGDAIDFYCDGLTGNQLYWFLDPWWSGGLGQYHNVPYLIYIDARSNPARWVN
jgi:tetratricopeptide (TPR) repeat protein